MSYRPGLRLVEPRSGRVLAARVEVPRTFVGRGLGLMFRRALPNGSAMWIDPCDGIHMFWMRFALDVVFLDRDLRVVRVTRGVKPWRVIPLVWGARSVVELPVGALAGLDLARSDQLAFEQE